MKDKTFEASNDSDFTQPGVRECRPLPQGLPPQFYLAPIQVGVGLILTEWNGVYSGFFDEFAVASLPDAAMRLKECDGTTLCYSFFFSGVVPAFRYDVDEPLFDSEEKTPYERSPVQADEPWHWCWDRTLFEIKFEPKYCNFFDMEPFEDGVEIDPSFDPYAGEYYLRVGGRTAGEAITNWELCANVIRKYFQI
jgi:hypothetical protein